jgi:hypothetical protein
MRRTRSHYGAEPKAPIAIGPKELSVLCCDLLIREDPLVPEFG